MNLRTLIPLALIATLPLSAQTASDFSPVKNTGNSTAQSASNEEVITLAEFQITEKSLKDSYIASEATAGTRTGEDIINLPYNVQVLTSDFINDFQLFEIEDQLGFISGATTGGIGGNARLRAFKPYYTRDGFQNFTTLISPSNILQTEVIKGPASVLYGRAAPGGIINFISKRPSTKPAYLAQLNYDTLGSFRANLNATGPLAGNKLYYLLNYEYRDDDSKQNVDFFFNRSHQLGLTLTYKLTPNTALTLIAETKIQRTTHTSFTNYYMTGGTYNNDYKKPTGITSAIRGWTGLATFNANGPQPRVNVDYYAGGLLLEHRFNKTWSFRATAQAWIKDTYYTEWIGASYYYEVMNGVLFDQREPRVLEQKETYLVAQADLLAQFKTGSIAHKILFALDATDYHLPKRLFSVDTNGAFYQSLPLSVRHLDVNNPDWSYIDFSQVNKPVSDYDADEYNLGAFASYRAFMFQNRLITMAALRYDWNRNKIADHLDVLSRNNADSTQDKITYSFGANLQLLGEKLLLYANTSTSFEPSGKVDIVSSEYLPPETGIGYEAGLKGIIKEHDIGYTLSLFHIKKQNVAHVNPNYKADGTNEYELNGEEGVKGAEFAASYIPFTGLTLLGTITYLDSELLDEGELKAGVPSSKGLPLVYTAKWQFSLALKYAFRSGALKGLNTGISIRHRTSLIADYADATFSQFNMDPFTDISAFASYSFTTAKRYRHTLRLNITNLTNEKVATFQGRFDPGCEAHLTYLLSF